MKIATMKGVIGLALCLTATVASAGTCEVSVTRTACSGKEALSYSKCNGKQSCTQLFQVGDAPACRKAANDACKNERLDITKSKVISAKFNGESLKANDGNSDFCIGYPNRTQEFDKCP